MTAARRLPILLWAATAAVALWLSWPTVEVGAEPLAPTLCPVGSVDQACARPLVNRPPDAVDDELRSRPGRTMRTNVLRNDSDPDGDALTVRPDANRTDGGTFSVSYTANDYDPDGDTMTVASQLNVKRDGTFSYTPAPGFVGRESFGYAVQDQYGLITGGRIVIDVENEAPVAANHRFRVRNDGTASGNVLVGATDPDGDPVRLHPFSVTADARTKEGGSLRIDRDGDFNYLPPPASSAPTASATRSSTATRPPAPAP
jgi:hypothetical protein